MDDAFAFEIFPGNCLVAINTATLKSWTRTLKSLEDVKLSSPTKGIGDFKYILKFYLKHTLLLMMIVLIFSSLTKTCHKTNNPMKGPGISLRQ